MKHIIFISFIVAFAVGANAQIIQIPADYPTIQLGIDASNPGDTVLVSPGTYIENINYYGKNITVASLFLTTMDTAYISQTIINGNQNGSVVYFLQGEDSTALLCGFTITNGNGGIYCINSSPRLMNLAIRENSNPLGGWGPPTGGAGIYCENSSPVIKNVTITNNASSVYGGGISCCQRSTPFLSDVTITHNSAVSKGGGIYCEGAVPLFDTINRCNIYQNSALEGNELYSDTLLNVIVDTFSVWYPTDFYAAPISNFSFEILHDKLVQVNADLYVSNNGDDNNSGLTPADPLKTMQYAFSIIRADSLNQNTVHLLEGTYTPASYSGIFPLDIPDYINLAGVIDTGVILDAKCTSRVFQIMDNMSNHISGLTIRGGYILNYNGGGILCDNSKPTFKNVIITNNTARSGEGYMNSGGGCGGGIYCNNSIPVFINVIVTGNYAFMGSDPSTGYNGGFGGGVCCMNSNPVMQNVTLTGNAASYHGGGICFWGSVPHFDTINRCNIYNNVASGHPGQFGGSDLYTDAYTEVVVDTFTVSVPTGFHAFPVSNFSFNILHGLHQQISADLYVSPQGDNHNSGLTANEPLKNIQCALSFMLSDSLNPHTIHLLEGTYSRMNSGEFYPLRIPEFANIEGISPQSVVLDADSTFRQVMQILNSLDTRISGLTITGGSKGGMQCSFSSPLIQNVYIFNNKEIGIDCFYSTPVLENVVISGNHGLYGGGGIYCGYYLSTANITLKNVTIINNMASYGYAISGAGANTLIVNSILWNNGDEIIGNPIVNYSNVQGGWPGEGNMDADPLFDTTGVYPLALSTGSPCINAGTPDTTGLNLPLTDIAGNPRIWGGRIDMGAYEWNNVGINESTKYVLRSTNYPNPINQSTIFSYTIKEPGPVTIQIFNSFGQMVEELLNANQTKGEQHVTWNVGNLPTGIYFYRIHAGNEVGGGKIIKW